MGLENRQGGNFITILGGKFCQRVTEGTEGALKRTNKIGNVVFEKFYDNFTGKLVDITTRDGDYGKSWNFMFQDKGEVYTLQLSYSNSFSTAFLKMLPNVDLTKEMKVSPKTQEVDGKRKSSLFINQDGKALKHAYTRDNPNGMPDMKQTKVKGVVVWDDTERLEWLEKMVEKDIKPKLTGPVEYKKEAPTGLAEDGAKEINVAEDVPF